MFSNIKNFAPFLKLQQYNNNFLCISLVLLFSVLLVVQKYNTSQTNFILNNFKNIVLFLYTISFVVFLFYFFILFNFKNFLFIKSLVFYNYNYTYLYLNLLDTSSIIIIYLCYIVGFVCLLTLGDRFWTNNYQLSILFIYFLIIINVLVSSHSLFELFVYYELLLLPSILFVHKSGYTKKSQQANVYFFLWTQFGSLLVLSGVLYIVAHVGNTSFSFLKNFNFTKLETYCLYLIFFFGFGIKVPLWPFHFWLIKVHVEAPSGFSIFLSGFLVKSAVFCFYKIILLFSIQSFYILPVILCICGMMDASIKLWIQVDIKKLIAYATVQEMNAIYLLFNFGDSWAINVGLIFLLAHGILSTLMFFLVECLYKRFYSRSLYKIYGVAQLYPNLGISIWGMLILFLGFPGTLKFYAEVQLCMFLLYNDIFLCFIIIFIFIFIGSVGFAKVWFSALYGQPQQTINPQNIKLDLTSEEFLIVSLLFFSSIFPCFFLYLL